DHPAASADAVELARLADAPWATGYAVMGWEQMVQRTCRELGGFEPDIRHRVNDVTIAVALVAGGLAVTMLPELVRADRVPGVVLRPFAERPAHRQIIAVTRETDAARPSTQALLTAIHAAADGL
ncbi:MAG: hypothetical protein QOG77_751, partial [Solirubrobacteraceae bacterium]|nr:hypothetical protein [Solirubrobacteraceae bacterium]